MRVWLFIVAVALAQPLACGARLGAEEVGLLAAEIAEQINALNGNRFLTREEASQRLFEIGLPAFDALLKSANGELPEAADRAVGILQRAARSKEGNAQLPALERLVQVQGRPEAVQQARLALVELKRPLAIARLLAAGGKILEQGIDDLFNQSLPKRVRIDRQWQGGDDGLKDVVFVNDAQVVHITSAKITAEGIANLRDMLQLRAIYIHGVPLNDTDLQKLRPLFPHALIDYKRGALLGITGQLNAAGAEVKDVRPKTVAARADFRPGDVIVLMNDQPVPTFKSLTDMIAKLAPGANATFVLRRGEETLTKKVTLGSW